jgi:hypothetical protein
MAYGPPYAQRERSRSRGRSVSSQSSSITSAYRLNMDGNFPPVQRWNGQTREATDWNSLRRDPELWHPQGNCLVYLFEKGVSRRGPSFRIPYDFLLYSSCRPIIDHSMTAGLQTSLYHPGSATPPSYDNLSDTLSHESSYCSIHLDAPSDMSRIERYNYHITTRNFFAWLVGAPLVGTDPVSALLDLKVRMDIWRDPGADNFGSLFQYVTEQSYGDFEDLEIQMSKRLDGEPHGRPQPYRNVSQTLEQQEKEVNRGRRSSISSIGQSIRSGSQRLRKKVSRTFSRNRGESESRTSPSPITAAPLMPSLRQDVHKIMQPPIRTRSPPRPVSQAPPISEAETAKPKKRESSLTRFAKKRLSWAAGPLRSDGIDEPMETDSGMVAPAPPGPPSAPAMSAPGPSEITALPATPTAAEGSRSGLSLQTKDFDLPAAPPNVPMRSSRRPSSGDLSQIDQVNNVGFSPNHTRSSSRKSLQNLSICACCGKPRKVQGVDSTQIPLHAEQLKNTNRGSVYSEINTPNYGNGVPAPTHIRRSSAQRHTGRHSSSHSFVSRNSSMARTPPGLDYSSMSDSGPVSPISRDSSVDVGPRGRAGYGERPRGISNPKLMGVNGLVSSRASNHSMDQIIWQLGHSREQTSGSDGSMESNESEVKKGKKRASVDSPTLGYAPASGVDMIGMARGSGIHQLAELQGREISEMAA